MTPEERAELRRMENEAAAAPWDKDWCYGVCRHIDKNVDTDCFYDGDGDGWGRYDGPFVAAMRNALIPLLDALDAAEKRAEEQSAFLKQAHEDNWTATGIDKLNTFAREERLPEVSKSDQLPEQIDNIVFHFKSLARKAEKERDELREESKALRAAISQVLWGVGVKGAAGDFEGVIEALEVLKSVVAERDARTKKK